MRPNVKIDFRGEDIPEDLSTEVSLCLFRVLQEALHNAVKYSGVREFEVALTGALNEIQLRVHDSGAGFDPKIARNGHGLGLTSMKERLKLVNGELFIESSPNQGTTVFARAPLTEGTNSAGAAAWILDASSCALGFSISQKGVLQIIDGPRQLSERAGLDGVFPCLKVSDRQSATLHLRERSFVENCLAAARISSRYFLPTTLSYSGKVSSIGSKVPDSANIEKINSARPNAYVFDRACCRIDRVFLDCRHRQSSWRFYPCRAAEPVDGLPEANSHFCQRLKRMSKFAC